ncbi:flagellar hook-length control protein FliK [Octadecabacter sp. CECT 8868]|uniref:flagellar hook-length control protein FliK n=1 Tax=Octadecabacter algicola TaxID=2909342 RepID=UPI001F2CCAA6|nr:flagellar hook-length control protein FliK [Octadecabacter algicola]MCF2905947.1 flagellar hook-length control protein FliK [Octadecabacter algicola]
MFQNESQSLARPSALAGTNPQHDIGLQSRDEGDAQMAFAEVLREQDLALRRDEAKHSPPPPLSIPDESDLATENDESSEQIPANARISGKSPNTDTTETESDSDPVEFALFEPLRAHQSTIVKTPESAESLSQVELVKRADLVDSSQPSHRERPDQNMATSDSPDLNSKELRASMNQPAVKPETLNSQTLFTEEMANTKTPLMNGQIEESHFLGEIEGRHSSPLATSAKLMGPVQAISSAGSTSSGSLKEAQVNRKLYSFAAIPENRGAKINPDKEMETQADGAMRGMATKRAITSIAPSFSPMSQDPNPPVQFIDRAISTQDGLSEVAFAESGFAIVNTTAPEMQTSNSMVTSRVHTPQIAAQIATVAAQTGTGTTEIVLNPEELGRIKMTLTNTDAGLSVSILAERPETVDLIRKNINDLIREFQDLGYESLEFTFDNQSDEPNQHDQDAQLHLSNITDQPLDDHATLTHIQSAISRGLDLKL